MSNHFHVTIFAFVVAGCFVCAGCTTKFNTATDAHNTGAFATAASNAESLAQTVSEGGKVIDLKVQYDRDELWVGLEKAKILADAGLNSKSVDLFEWVNARAQFLGDAESWYVKNPCDVSRWDVGQFSQDVGKFVMGADQTTYIVQPYELILVNAYASLNSLLCNEPGAVQFTRTMMKLQEYEKEDLRRAGYDDMEAPIAKMDSTLAPSLKGNSTDFSFGRIFSLGDFTGAKQRFKSAIDSARQVGAADPRIPFATVVQWVSFMSEGAIDEAAAAAKEVGASCGATTLSEQMGMMSTEGNKDFVLVLIDAGRGPIKNSFEVKFPIMIPNVGSALFRAVYPDLIFRTGDRPNEIKVGGAGAMQNAFVLDSIDAIAARNFQRREAELWWTPTIRAVLRTVASIVAQATQEKEDTGARLLIALVGAAVAVAEQPDLRAWSTLPAEQYAAIVPRPANGVLKVELKSVSSSGSIDVPVEPGSSIVYVRALTPTIHYAKSAVIVKPK